LSCSQSDLQDGDPIACTLGEYVDRHRQRFGIFLSEFMHLVEILDHDVCCAARHCTLLNHKLLLLEFQKQAMTVLKWLVITTVVGYGGLLALMFVFQRALMYFPDATHTLPAFAGLPQAEEVTLASDDGETLIAWYVGPRGDKPIVIYFHGNAGALNLRAERFTC
jgi:hypothetical protein